MSVLNKMLRDLEQRQASTNTATELQHSISREDGRPLWLNLLLILSAALLLFAIYAILTRPELSESIAKPVGTAAEVKPADIPAISLDETPARPHPSPVEQPKVQTEIAEARVAEVTESVAKADSVPVKMPDIMHSTDSTHVDKPSAATAGSDEDVALPAAAAAQQQSKPEIAVQRTLPSTAQRAEALQQRAVLAVQSGQLTDAINLWQQVQQLMPNQPDAYIAQAQVWQQLGVSNSAQQILQQGVAENSDNAQLRLLLAQHYASSQRWSEADAVLTPQFELTLYPQYYGFKATVLQQLGDSTAAGYWFNQLILSQPEQARWWLGAAIAFDQSGQRQQANIHYRQALQWGDSLSAESRNYIQQRLAATE